MDRDLERLVFPIEEVASNLADLHVAQRCFHFHIPSIAKVFILEHLIEVSAQFTFIVILDATFNDSPAFYLVLFTSTVLF